MYPLYDPGKTDAIIIKEVSCAMAGDIPSGTTRMQIKYLRMRKRAIAFLVSKEAFFLKVIIKDKTQAFP